jgi:hypothetical protein
VSIPELKNSFDSLERELPRILKLKGNARIKEFQEVWKRLFGRPVNSKAAEAYLHVKSKSGKRSTRKVQRGGNTHQISGAPLDYMTRPGISGTYGSFPAYQVSGLGEISSQTNLDGLASQCGKENITPQIPADLGSNKVGGGNLLQSIGDMITGVYDRPVAPTVPTSLAYDLQTAAMGRPLPPSPAAYQTTLKLQPTLL